MNYRRENIFKTYHIVNRSRAPSVRSVTIEPVVCCDMGPSGSGKSLDDSPGLIRDSGNFPVDGRDDRLRKKISFFPNRVIVFCFNNSIS